MYSNIFDTHAHYNHRLFDYIRYATLSGMPDLGVSYILNCGSDEDSSFYSAALAEDYDFVFSAAGIHPTSASNLTDGWKERLLELLKHKKVIAVGEIGLDYHYGYTPPELQRKLFAEFMEIANERQLPVVIHDRDAHNDIISLINEYKPKGVVHRFSGSLKMMEQLIDLDMHMGFGCSIAYSKSQPERDAVRMIPIDRLLLETDCPYLPPPDSKYEICRSDMISYAADTIAELRPSYSAQQIIDIATENGKRLFQIG
ncbi:MAG: TatD family hydrolase [Oscillospiraceae bacterium]|nr:TatD family hydrolase [Oscillospiraceae bacterium]